jgi:GNAT superfamily N-acetyltransferase
MGIAAPCTTSASIGPSWSRFGRQMIAAAEDWMRQRGVWKANLLVRTGNEAVLAFYEELGYARGSSVPIEKWLDPSKRGGA